MNGRLTRRKFVGRAGSLVFAGSFLSACGGKLVSTGTTASTTTVSGDALAVFLLSTDDSTCKGTRCACKACVQHAANKLFATSDAANAGRAHVHCNCSVVQDTLAPDRWTALFGDPAGPARTNVDRRNADVQRILS